MTRRTLFTSLILAAMATAAEAHTGVGGTAGFGHGFAHPFTGLDHVLTMVAVGLFAAHLGSRALWLVPGAFVAMMAAGGAAGMAGLNVPFVEAGIALSVIVMGAVIALRWTAPVLLAMALAGVFAIFHGHAHGAEMPAAASGLSYAIGFILATAALHAIGIAAGLGLRRLSRPGSRRIVQAAGAAMALAGMGLLTGVV